MVNETSISTVYNPPLLESGQVAAAPGQTRLFGSSLAQQGFDAGSATVPQLIAQSNGNGVRKSIDLPITETGWGAFDAKPDPGVIYRTDVLPGETAADAYDRVLRSLGELHNQYNIEFTRAEQPPVQIQLFYSGPSFSMPMDLDGPLSMNPENERQPLIKLNNFEEVPLSELQGVSAIEFSAAGYPSEIKDQPVAADPVSLGQRIEQLSSGQLEELGRQLNQFYIGIPPENLLSNLPAEQQPSDLKNVMEVQLERSRRELNSDGFLIGAKADGELDVYLVKKQGIYDQAGNALSSLPVAGEGEQAGAQPDADTSQWYLVTLPYGYESQIPGRYFSNSILKNHDFANRQLDEADLSSADLRSSTFAGSSLRLADLANADLRRVDFTNADLNDAILSSARLQDANFSGASLRGVIWHGAKLNANTLKSIENLAALDLSQVDLSRQDLRGINFKNADLREANLFSAKAPQVDLSNANLSSANLRGANLRGADLSGADLQGAGTLRADLRGANLQGANLSNLDLSTARLKGADLTGAIITNTVISDRQKSIVIGLNDAIPQQTQSQARPTVDESTQTNGLLQMPQMSQANALVMEIDNAYIVSNGGNQSFLQLMSSPAFKPLLDRLQISGELPLNSLFIPELTARLNELKQSGELFNFLPEKAHSTIELLHSMRRVGIKLDGTLFGNFQALVGKLDESQITQLRETVKQMDQLTPKAQDYFVFTSSALLSNALHNPEQLQKLPDLVEATMARGLSRLYPEPSNVNPSAHEQALQRVALSDIPTDSIYNESVNASLRESQGVGIYEYLGSPNTDAKFGLAIVSGKALEQRLSSQALLQKAGLKAADFGVELFGQQYLGEHNNIPSYAVAVNHIPGSSLREEMSDGVDFSDQDIQTIRQEARRINRSLLDKGLLASPEEIHPGNIIVSRNEAGAIDKVNLIDLEPKPLNPVHNKTVSEVQALLHLEETLLRAQPELLQNLETEFVPSLLSRLSGLSVALGNYISGQSDPQLLLSELKASGKSINRLPESLQSSFQQIIQLALQGSQFETTQLQKLSVEQKSDLGLSSDGNSLSQASGESPLGFDANGSVDPQGGQNPQARFGFDGDIPGISSSTTSFGTLNPASLNPNGIIGNNGSQAGQAGNGGRGNAPTAVAAPGGDNPFSNNIPDQVPLDWTGSLNNISIPSSVPSWMNLPIDPDRPDAPASSNSEPAAGPSISYTPESDSGGVTIGGQLGSPGEAERTNAEMEQLLGKGWRQGLRPDLPPTIIDNRIPGFGEGVPPADASSNDTSWGLPDEPITLPESEGFPEKDPVLDEILNPNGVGRPQFTFPPIKEGSRIPEVPAEAQAALTKALPELQGIRYAQFSQLSTADQQQVLPRTLAYQQLAPNDKTNISLIEYLDSRKTSEPQRQQLSRVDAAQTVQQAQLNTVEARTGLDSSTIDLINARIKGLQANTAQINQQTQSIQQSNAQRINALATQAQTDPVGVAFIKPEAPQSTPENRPEIKAPVSQNSAPIPRFMVVRTENGPKLIENLANGQSQLHAYPLSADTPITRQEPNGAWSGVPDVGQIGSKLFLDLLFTNGALKMLNNGNPVQAPNSGTPQQPPVNGTPQTPTGIPQPGF